MKEIKCNIVKKIGALSNPEETYVKELNIVEWGNNGAKYDLRTWKHNQESGEVTASKGITLSKDELLKLKELLNGLEI